MVLVILDPAQCAHPAGLVSLEGTEGAALNVLKRASSRGQHTVCGLSLWQKKTRQFMLVDPNGDAETS